ncbi:hypothetical protein GM921_06835 [Pedobacter sp. LMG 31464]|uniref:Uncharacterized protein n=1 Tax=Pedobacter planticolens TaxID=2679964 RepID=A0A923DWC5_9SPHI|nr:hypothetical protein [Pedobacter planticolens]MBB2145191.1 hypothetical protein [Pedobacter planticolens]
MAFNFRKNLSLITTIAVIVIAGVGGYYLINLKQGPYPASSFISITYKWGVGDTLANSYNSATSQYQYLDNMDKLIKRSVKLHANNVIFIHSKANELDIWSLPDVIANKNEDLKSKKVLRYEIVFNYEKRTKKIIFMTDYDENIAVADRADQLQKMIKQTIDEVEDRYSK